MAHGALLAPSETLVSTVKLPGRRPAYLSPGHGALSVRSRTTSRPHDAVCSSGSTPRVLPVQAQQAGVRETSAGEACFGTLEHERVRVELTGSSAASPGCASHEESPADDRGEEGSFEEETEHARSFSGHESLTLVGKCAKSIDKFYSAYDLPRFQEVPGKAFTVRVRQHVNPLKSSLAAPVKPPKWEEVYTDPHLPLFLDVGCASARLSLVMALRSLGKQNVLGLEIRQPLVERANLWAKEQMGLSNATFLVANATLSLGDLLKDYPGPLAFVAVLCPDPQFKKRHHKRRIVQPAFVEAVANRIAPGGTVFLQSDILEVAEDMRSQFREHAPDKFDFGSGEWVAESPLGVPSEREAVVLAQGKPVFRTVLKRL